MLKDLIKSLIPVSLKTSLKAKLGVPSQQKSLKNLKSLGFSPNFCLDIGAYEGCWTKEFKDIFPNCAVLMVEAQAEKQSLLNNVKQLYKDVDYNIALLGAKETEVIFNKYETASSVLTETNVTNAKTEKRSLQTLDKLIAEKKPKPDFIKVDTQGYELEILKGGELTLSAAEVVLLEVSFIDIYTNAPLAAEVLSYMNERGFFAYDICTLMYRPFDKALYQADILFVKKDSFLRANKRWD